MKTYETVITEQKDHVGVITLNRPNQMNAFNLKLVEDTLNALIEMEEDREIRVLILKGAGKDFCAGMDVKTILEGSPTEREYLSAKS